MRSVLVLPLQSIEQPSTHLLAVAQAAEQTTHSLTVIFTGSLDIQPTTQWQTLHRFLAAIYGEAVRTAQRLGRVLWDVDVLFEGLSDWKEIDGWDVIFRVANRSFFLPLRAFESVRAERQCR